MMAFVTSSLVTSSMSSTTTDGTPRRAQVVDDGVADAGDRVGRAGHVEVEHVVARARPPFLASVAPIGDRVRRRASWDDLFPAAWHGSNDPAGRRRPPRHRRLARAARWYTVDDAELAR